MTFTHALPTNNYGTAKFIVTSSSANGTHTTIAAALTAASSGDTIFIRPGTYTENLTLKAGVDLVAFSGDGDTPNVTIVGNATLTTAGTVTISNIRLQTTSAALLTVSGSAASIVNLKSCYLNCTNNTGIIYSSSDTGSAINVLDCRGDIGTTGIALFTATGAGTGGISATGMYFKNTEITNSGASTTANTTSTCLIITSKCKFFNPFTTSSVGGFGIYYTQIECANQNATALTTAGTGAANSQFSHFTSGSSSAISIGSGTTVTLTTSEVSSTNTNAIVGAGTLLYTAISFAGASSGCNVTTQTPYSSGPAVINTKQPCFTAYNSSIRTDVTGDGTSYTLIFDTELFDQGGNFDGTSTFTAPQTGKYLFTTTILAQQAVATMSVLGQIVTTGATYSIYNSDVAVVGNNDVPMSVIAAMTAGDTCVVKVVFSNGTKIVDIYGAGGDIRTSFSGCLLC